MRLTCVLWHGERIRERTADGVYVLRCQDCGHDIPVLQSETVTTGPCHQPAAVWGTPTGRVQQQVTRSKITPFARDSQR